MSAANCPFKLEIPDFRGENIQPKTKLYNHLALQFSDFQLKSFVDPKPVEL